MFVSAQEFDGIKIGGSESQFISAMEAKGYKVKSKTDVVIQFDGNSAHPDLELYAVVTHKSRLVWKFSVYLPKETSWYHLKKQYNDYLQVLTEKYGKPDKTYAFFASPYDEGDGYEMTAVKVEKCDYVAFWGKQISIDISKYCATHISYENEANSALDTKEQDDDNKRTF